MQSWARWSASLCSALTVLSLRCWSSLWQSEKDGPQERPLQSFSKPSRAHSALLHAQPALTCTSRVRASSSSWPKCSPRVLRVSLTQAFIDFRTCSFSTWRHLGKETLDGPPEGAGSQPRAISGAKSGPVIGLVVVQVAWEEDIGSRGVRNGNIPRPAHPLAS